MAYADAELLPQIPAHPRCRCTIAAVYRDEHGSIIDAVAPPVEPVTPPQIKQEPTHVPEAAGDIDEALGRVVDAQRRYLAGEDVSAEKQFWRSTDIEPHYNAILAGTKMPEIVRRTDAVMTMRYGIRLNTDTKQWTQSTLRSSLIALERWRKVEGGRYVVDSPSLQYWGMAPPRVRGNISSGRAAEMYASCHMRLNHTAMGKLRNGSYGLNDGTDPGAFVLAHEIGHSVHNRYGAHPHHFLPREFGDQRTTSPSDIRDAAFDWNKRWMAVRDQTVRGPNGRQLIAPAPRARAEALRAAVFDADETIARYQKEIDRVIARDGPGSPFAQTYRREMIRAQQARESAKLALDGIDNTAGIEYRPTEYAGKTYMEDFAETTALYMLEPEWLRRVSPIRYQWVKDNVFGGKEFIGQSAPPPLEVAPLKTSTGRVSTAPTMTTKIDDIVTYRRSKAKVLNITDRSANIRVLKIMYTTGQRAGMEDEIWMLIR